jgi:hypothetical protein
MEGTGPLHVPELAPSTFTLPHLQPLKHIDETDEGSYLVVGETTCNVLKLQVQN